MLSYSNKQLILKFLFFFRQTVQNICKTNEF